MVRLPGYRSWSALQGWGSYLQLALPSMGACCLEWWLYEGLIIIAGTLPDADIAVAVMVWRLHLHAWHHAHGQWEMQPAEFLSAVW